MCSIVHSLDLKLYSFRTASSGVLPYDDAYATCCRSTVRCTKEDDAWFSRLLRKRPLVSRGRATLYWAHMRKAGGTSLKSSIESGTFNNTHDPNAAFTRGFVRTVKQHLQAGSRHCVDHPYANETLFVTILRHPVDRYASEYFYLNIGSKLKSNATKDKVVEWHNMSVTDNGVDMKRARHHFVENWQTRWYTNPNACEDLDRPPPHDSHPNYSYWRSGVAHDPRNLVREEDLETAKAVLDKFDVVGIAPYFGGERSLVPWLILAGSDPPADETDAVHNRGRGSPAALELKENIRTHLREQIKFDLELFDFARGLVTRRTAISRCVADVRNRTRRVEYARTNVESGRSGLSLIQAGSGSVRSWPNLKEPADQVESGSSSIDLK